MQKTITKNLVDYNKKSRNEDFLEQEILECIENSKIGCKTNLAIERLFISERKIERTKIHSTLIRLCKNGLIDLLIPDDSIKEWDLHRIKSKKVRIKGNNKNNFLIIPEGAYYSWSFKDDLFNSEFNNLKLLKSTIPDIETKIFDKNNNRMNHEGRDSDIFLKQTKLLVDTYFLRNFNKLMLNFALIKVSALLKHSSRLNYKMLWTISSRRNEIPL